MSTPSPPGVAGTAQLPGGGSDTGPYHLFISYRREDSPDFVEHIRSWFAWRFGRSNVFMDFDSIPAGTQFPDYIRDQIKQCDAMLVIIGPGWVEKIREDPFNENDWVRTEIRLALEANKLVVPVCIKRAAMPEPKHLPENIRGMLNIQAAYLEPGRHFTDAIETTMASVYDLLTKRFARKKVIEDLDAISPAAGLALGYYVNFVKRIGTQLAEPGTSVTDVRTQHRLDAEELRSMRLQIIIPPRIALFKADALARIGTALGQVAIETPSMARPILLLGLRQDHGFQLIDFPSTIAVLENWLRRRMQKEGLNPRSEESLRLEQQELDGFESVLKWWIDDQANEPAFRERVEVVRFTPNSADLKWLADAWRGLVEAEGGIA